MAEMIQFDGTGRKPMCLVCEEMLTDAVDRTLSDVDQVWFDRHVCGCVDCAEMVADAQRGAAWLEMLKSSRPEPSYGLMERILQQTSGLETGSVSMEQGLSAAKVIPFAPRVPRFAKRTGPWFMRRGNSGFEPRLALTAAMAFFSVALTLNLAGVRLDQLNRNALNPTKVKQTYYEASAEAVRYYDNLHVVRLVESRVDEVSSQGDSGPQDEKRDAVPKGVQSAPGLTPGRAPEPTKKQDKKDRNPGGMSRRTQPSTERRRAMNQEAGLV
jgi:hypothetical protein